MPATHPLVLGVLDRVLGHYQFSAPTGIEIGPGEVAQATAPRRRHLPAAPAPREVVVNTMWALDDFTEANGATRIVPGSHRWIDRATRPAHAHLGGGDAGGIGAVLSGQRVARRRGQHHRPGPPGGDPRVRGVVAPARRRTTSCAVPRASPRTCRRACRSCSATTSAPRSWATSTAATPAAPCPQAVAHATVVAAVRCAMADTVLYERTGHVATITYNRPEVLNAVNGELRRDLNDAFARFRDEEEAWVAIVTGAGRGLLRRGRPARRGRIHGEFAGTLLGEADA